MIIVSIFLIGLFIGSFLGVLVDRIPFNRPFLTGRSKCDKCNKELGFMDLIPVISFILTKGHCRYCKASLPFFYPTIEIVTAIIFSLTYIILAPNSQFLIPNQVISFIYYLIIASGLIVIFFTDLKYGMIPEKILLPTILVSLVWVLFHPLPFIINHLLSGLFSFLFLLSVSFIFYFLTKKESMGGGDIKFVFFMGLILGFPNIIVSFYLAFLTGAAYSIILILWKKKSFRKDTIPFGPFLAIATFISIFWGNFLLEKALGILGI